MTDWKQITARIRRARTSKDPRDNFRILPEDAGRHGSVRTGEVFRNFRQNADAAKWYSAAAERFRRSDWKVKAQEARSVWRSAG